MPERPWEARGSSLCPVPGARLSFELKLICISRAALSTEYLSEQKLCQVNLLLAAQIAVHLFSDQNVHFCGQLTSPVLSANSQADSNMEIFCHPDGSLGD